MSDNTTASVPLTLDADVALFLQRRDAVEAFQDVCEAARQSYPDLQRLEVTFEADEVEFGREFIVLLAILPDNYPVNQMLEQSQAYRRRAEERVAPSLLRDICLYPNCFRGPT